MSNTKKKQIWYDYGKLLSYNKKYNFVEGIRGRGKTCQGKKFSVKQFLDKGHKTVWLRYNQDQMREARDGFIEEVELRFPELMDGVEWKYNHNSLFINGKEAVRFRAITVMSKTKGAFFDDDFKYIIYDEYITEFTAGEDIEPVIRVIETIERHRDDVKHFYLGNAITRNNPYLKMRGVKISDLEQSEYVSKGDCVVHSDFYNESFKKMKKSTKSGKMQMQHGYGEHSIDGKYLLDDFDNIANMKTKEKKLLFVIDEVAVWRVVKDNANKTVVLWCSSDLYDVYHKVKFTTSETRFGFRSIKDFPKVKKILQYHSFKNSLAFQGLPEKAFISQLL